MARDVNSIFKDVDIWAKNGDKSAPAFALNTGWASAYSNPKSQGGVTPSRETFNYILNRLTLLAQQLNAYGSFLVWDSIIAYKKGANVTGSNGLNYIAIQDNIGVDPVTVVNEDNWVNYDKKAIDFRNSSGIATVIGDSILLSGVAGTYRLVTYSVTPNIDITNAPTYPINSVIYSSDRFTDHGYIGQLNTWNLDFTYSNPNKDAMLTVVLRQVDTAKEYISELQILKENNINAKFTAMFNTISTAESIDITKGYQVFVKVFQNDITSIQLNSVSRYTTPKQ